MTVGAGDLAPAFELPDLDGRPVRFEPQAPGYKLLLFYKNSCPTCQFALPLYDRLAQNSPGAFCRAIAQDTPEEARALSRQLGLSLSQCVDERPHPVSRAYGFLNVPTSFVVDPGGRVVVMSPAFVKADLLQAAALLSSVPAAELFAPLEQVPQLKPG